jgi:circadian clock protein KaiC
MPPALSTGIEGLDHVLSGGLPPNRLYLVQGDPGVGKTTLGLQFLIEGVRRGEKVLYLTLSESAEELRAVAASHGWSLDGVHIYEHVQTDISPRNETSVFYASEVELGETVTALLQVVEEHAPDRVVVDALSEIRLLAQTSLRYRRQILALKQFFIGRNATVLLLDDRTGEAPDMQLQSVPHGVIELERYTPLYGAARRRMQVVKLRALSFRDGYHDFAIRKGGVVVFPRLVAAEQHRQAGDRSKIASGITSLDAMLGGGVDRGTSTLIMGPAGSGKSALSTQYAVAAAQRGERAVLLTFEESLESVYERSASLGMDLSVFIDSGRIVVRQVDPAQLQPGEFADMVRGFVSDGVSVVVIDSINGYLNAVPEERFLMLHLHELLTYLGKERVATLLVFAQHGVIGSMATSIDLSYLADSILLLRFYESQGKLHKAISVVKKRRGVHDHAIRAFSMSDGGLHVGAPLENFRGVLSGVPAYEGTVVVNGAPDGR